MSKPELNAGEKQKAVTQLNEIQTKLQGVYFELESFTDNDPASASLTKMIDLMNAVRDIHNRILKGENETDKASEKT